MCSDRFALALGLLWVSTFTAACAGTLDDPDRFRDAGASTSPVDAAAASACAPGEAVAVVEKKCATAGCHAAAGAAAGLDLASPDVLPRLANKAAAGGPGSLVVPGDPEKSVLFTKLTASPPFGSRMPLGGNLDDGTLACVRDWIAASH